MEVTGRNDVELISKTLQLDHKLFYFDFKENSRGRYLKISEKTAIYRSTIIVPHAGFIWFVNLFNYYINGDDPELSSKHLHLESKQLLLGTKVFYFDVGENQRGRFLKISEASVQRNRSTIIVPAGHTAGEGWAAFRDILSEIDEAQQLFPWSNSSVSIQKTSGFSDNIGGLSDTVSSGLSPGVNPQAASSESVIVDDSVGLPLPSVHTGGVARVIRAEQKKFFFDLGSNARGQYLRISEVTGADRSVIILPVSTLDLFHETLGQFAEIVRNQRMQGTGVASIRTVAPRRKQSDV
eukprot:c27268_g1_i1 orf=525-1409(-)